MVTQIGHVTLGCYGGNTTAGAQKNEDAAMILVAPDDNLNQIVLMTDGVLEFGQRPYEDSRQLYTIFEARKTQGLSGQREAHEEVLQSIHAGMGRDSATIISFAVDTGSYDSSLPY